MIRQGIVVALLAASCAGSAAAPAPAPITREELAAHLRFLSSDLLEGRGAGTPGDAIAVSYIETMFRLDHLAPAFGDSYVQEFPLRRVVTDPQVKLEFLAPGGPPLPCRLGDDFVVTFPFPQPEHDFTADLVFVGYGIVAREWRWDDYKDADVRGKILLILAGEPSDGEDFFEGKALTRYGRWTYKLEEAARRGALGAFLVHTTEGAAYGWEVVRNSWRGPSLFDPENRNLVAVEGWITNDIGKAVAARAGRDLDSLRAAARDRSFRPVPLAVKMHVNARNTYDEVRTANVAGVVRGRLPQDRAQALVISAHHDHLGRGVAEGGDDIYNGAIDNAAALSVVLGLARVLGAQPGTLDSDVIFFAPGAEEDGLLGSEYFVHHPPLPPSRMVADLNMDMIGVWSAAHDLVAAGAKYSEILDVMTDVARRRGLVVSPERAPEQGYFYRSDQLSFARVGVPGVRIDVGDDLVGEPPGTGERLRAEYRANRYHRPSDEFDPRWPLAGTVQLSEILLEMIAELDHRGLTVDWKPGAPYHR